MKIIVSILILAALTSGQHLTPVKRAILGKGYGKIEVESIDKSVEVRPNLGTQNALYLSPPIKDLPIQDSAIQQPTINHLEPPYPPKEAEKPYHAEPLQQPITSMKQTYEPQEQRYSNLNYLPPTQINGLSATSASGYNAEGYLPPDRNHHPIIQPQVKHVSNQPFQAPRTPLVENQPTYKDYITRIQTPESHEEYYKAPGYLPPPNNQQSLKLSLVSNSPFLKNLQQHNNPGYLPPSENKVVFPQSGSTYEAPGYLPPSSHSSGQTTTRLVPVKDNFQISQQGYTEAFIQRKLPYNHEYAASDYLPPSNQPLTSQNSNIEPQPNIYGASSPIHPPKPIPSHPTSIQAHSASEYLPPQNNGPQKHQADESYSAPGYLPPQENVQINKPGDNGSPQHQTYSTAGYLPPNQQGNYPTDIDVRIGNDQRIQHGNNNHNGYDYSKPQGPAFHEGRSQSNIQTLIDESHNSYHNAEQSHKSQNAQNHASLENQIQTIKIIRENANGQQESIRTIQIIAENDQSNAIRTIKILKDSQAVDNTKTIKLIDYSSPSNNGYLPPQSTVSSNYSPNKFPSQQVHHQNTRNLTPPNSLIQAPLLPTNQPLSPLSSNPTSNNYLPPDSIATNAHSPKQFSPQHDESIKNLQSPIISMQASSSSNNGYLPPEQVTTHHLHDNPIKNMSPPSNSIQIPFPSSSSNNGYLPPQPALNNFPQQNFPSGSRSNLQFNSQSAAYLPPTNQPLSPPHSNPTSNNYLPPSHSSFDVIKIISENDHDGEDPAIYASVAAANLNNVRTIQIVNGRNTAETRPNGDYTKGYTKTRLLRFYRRF